MKTKQVLIAGLLPLLFTTASCATEKSRDTDAQEDTGATIILQAPVVGSRSEKSDFVASTQSFDEQQRRRAARIIVEVEEIDFELKAADGSTKIESDWCPSRVVTIDRVCDQYAYGNVNDTAVSCRVIGAQQDCNLVPPEDNRACRRENRLKRLVWRAEAEGATSQEKEFRILVHAANQPFPTNDLINGQTQLPKAINNEVCSNPRNDLDGQQRDDRFRCDIKEDGNVSPGGLKLLKYTIFKYGKLVPFGGQDHIVQCPPLDPYVITRR